MQAFDLTRAAGFPIDSLIHIGANTGQECAQYFESGASPCIYVEPIGSVFDRLCENIKDMPGHIAVQAVCSDISGESIVFNVANNGGMSSSILPLGAHADYYPSITYLSSQRMVTTTVDELITTLDVGVMPNLMVIDVQGAELKVLRGAQSTLTSLDAIFAEVSERPLYEGGCTHDQITSFLAPFGFRLRWMELNALGHGDAFYCRAFTYGSELPTHTGNKAIGGMALQSSVSGWSRPDDATGAINGKKTGSYGFHTAVEIDPWWQVDLRTKVALDEIRVFNRIDAGRDRAGTLRVLTSLDGVDWTLVHDQKGRSFGGVNGRPLRVMMAGEPARFVRLQLNDTNYLHLDEVEIYGAEL